jgi:hypothetical protein
MSQKKKHVHSGSNSRNEEAEKRLLQRSCRQPAMVLRAKVKK